MLILLIKPQMISAFSPNQNHSKAVRLIRDIM